MDVYAEDFSLSEIFKENKKDSIEAVKNALDSQLSELKKTLDSGLKPDDYVKAQHLQAALVAAQSIVNLRQTESQNNKG